MSAFRRPIGSLKTAFVLSVVLVAGAPVHGAAPRWAEAIGGDGDDGSFSIQQTTDSGAIVAGYGRELVSTSAYYSDDIFIVKLDPTGAIKWQKAYWQGTDSEYRDEDAAVVRQTKDGGYIVAGYIEPQGTWYQQALVMKLDSSGNIAWQKTFGGKQSWARAIQQTADKGYIVAIEVCYAATYDPTDIWLIKLEQDGDVTWQKKYGSRSAYERPGAVQQTADGGYIVAGRMSSKSTKYVDNGLLLKVDSTGNVTWWKQFGGYGNQRVDRLHSVRQTADLGYVAAGETMSYGAGKEDAWILKFDSAGAIQWQKTYGGKKTDFAHRVALTKDGGYAFVGGTKLAGSYLEAWLVKLDATGSITWQKHYGAQIGPQSGNDVYETKDLGFMLTGYTQSFGEGDADLWTLRVDKAGLIDPTCTITGDTVATVKDSTAVAKDYTADVTDTYADPTTSSLVAVTTQGTVNRVCGSGSER